MTGSGSLVPSAIPSNFILTTGDPIIVVEGEPLKGKRAACSYSMNATVTLSLLLMRLRMLCGSEADASNFLLVLPPPP